MKESLFDVETVLITRRTVARRFREHEGAVFFDLYHANAPVLSSLLPEVVPAPGNALEAEYFVRSQLAAWLRQESLPFAIWDKENARMIGYVSLTPSAADWRKAQITGFIDKDKNRQGLMTEVLQSLLQVAFRQILIEKIALVVSTENTAGQRLAKRCGFLREGELREEFQRNSGEPIDAVLFGISRSQYPSY
jgi:RimJ/RimL family protein N-acetyltransferase